MGLISNFRRSRALKRARAMASNGKAPEAIDVLRQRNRAQPDALVERTVVDLMLQHRATHSNGASPAQQSHNQSDNQSHINAATRHFESGSIPEIDAADLTAETLRAAIDQAGYLIVRGYFDQADTAEIRNCIDASLEARVEAEERAEAPQDNPWYYPSPHFPGTHVAFSKLKKDKQFSRTGSIMVIDSPRGSFRILELYRKYGLKKLVDGYFREPAVLATRKWVFRLIEPRDLGHGIGGGWHQDGRFMGEGIRALNMWVALTECGEGTEAPGITLLPKRITEILETGTRGANIDWVVPGALVEELHAENAIVNPHFRDGDALFFDHFSLHRSGHEPGLTRNRYALESWFYASTAIADNSVLDLH